MNAKVVAQYNLYVARTDVPPAGDVSGLGNTAVFVTGALKRGGFTEPTHAFAMTEVAVHTRSRVQKLISVRS